MLLSLYKNYSFDDPRVIIRTAQAKDKEELAALAYKCYYNRFFDEETIKKKGGSLRLYPELIPDDEKDLGQNLKSFQNYWEKAMGNLNNEEGRFICIVAEQASQESRKIIGFVKGYSTPADRGFDKEKTGELGSLYIDPGCQKSQIGRLLTQFYARDLQKIGYESMITQCYSLNNSQNFFAKMGAEYLCSSQIPNVYRQGDGEEKICYIPGDVMFWNKKAMAKLVDVNVLEIAKGRDIWGRNVKEPIKISLQKSRFNAIFQGK